MASLNSKLEGFENPITTGSDPTTKSVCSFLKSKIRKESTAYKNVGTTGLSDAKIFLILEDYLQPDSKTSLESTVQSILSLIPENAPMSNEVCMVGEVFLKLAEQIPYHHPSQIKLVRAVEELCRSAKVTCPPDDMGMQFRFFRFKESRRDWYTGPDEDVPIKWPNINAFFANEQNSHIRPHNTLFAVWTMRDAFEERPEDIRDGFEGIRDQQIIAAAQYILWDGQSLFKHVICPGEESIESDRAMRAGPLFDGDDYLTLTRWRFWQRGFQSAAENADFNEECRKVRSREQPDGGH